MYEGEDLIDMFTVLFAITDQWAFSLTDCEKFYFQSAVRKTHQRNTLGMNKPDGIAKRLLSQCTKVSNPTPVFQILKK